MVTDGAASIGVGVESERRLPPVTQLAVASMMLVIAGGIYLAAYLPKPAPLGLPIALLAVAIVLVLANIVALSRLHDFAWDTFFLVGRWTLLAYMIIAGMLEYVFIVDQVRSGMLVIVTLTLLVYAVDIPLLLSFSVARYQAPSHAAEG